MDDHEILKHIQKSNKDRVRSR